MTSLVDFERVNELFDIYGGLLSKSQNEIMSDYYRYNLSISEISENRNISRAAVNDALIKGKQNLEHYEEVLGVLKNNKEVIKLLNELKTSLGKDDIKKVEYLERRLTNGI